MGRFYSTHILRVPPVQALYDTVSRRKEVRLPMPRCFPRRAALFFAALVFTLSACAPSELESPQNSEPEPGQSVSISPSAEISPSASPSEDPSPSADASPSASPSEHPSSSAGAGPSASQSESPSPSASAGPEPADPPDVSSSPIARPSAPSGPVPEGEDVGNDWFADAVFLGDSRTDGLRLYSGIKGATFICHTGLSVFTIGKNACIKDEDGEKITAMDALAKQQYAKVYLMLGVNELGYTTTSFLKSYTELVEQIKALQPGAAIYLQTLIPINETIAYSNGTNRGINNAKLKEFNEVITHVAQEEGVFLVDVDAPFWSEEGCLAAENTGDGVHLTRAGYEAWYAYLRTHTGDPFSSAGLPPEEESSPSYTPGLDPYSAFDPLATPSM